MTALIVVALFLSVGARGANAGQGHEHTPDPSDGVRVMTGLGSHHHRISTRSPEAQRLFDQGLVLLYGFNHAQAIRLFQRAAELDPQAPMPVAVHLEIVDVRPVRQRDAPVADVTLRREDL